MSKIIALFGADHRCGLSQVAIGISTVLAEKNKNSKVLLLNASMQFSKDYAPGVNESMERIRPYLSGKLFDLDEIMKKALYKDNLYIVGGPNSIGSLSSFNPEDVSLFLYELSKNFDYTICDCGADINAGLSLGALFSADEIGIVMDQSMGSLRRLEWIMPLIKKLGLEPSFYIVNKYSSSESLSFSYLLERLSLDKEKLFKLRLSSKGKMADIKDRFLISFGGSFLKDIKKIVCKI